MKINQMETSKLPFFKPIKFSITIESKAEAENLYSLFNTIPIIKTWKITILATEIRNILHGYSNSTYHTKKVNEIKELIRDTDKY